MAFVSRIGNALRRTSVSNSAPLLQPVRCMSSSKLFVGGMLRSILFSSVVIRYSFFSFMPSQYLISLRMNLLLGLSYATDETTLKNVFSAYGNVLEGCVSNLF
jgi:heterogeneous nuclear ribonucleoprotein A1/A3